MGVGRDGRMTEKPKDEDRYLRLSDFHTVHPHLHTETDALTHEGYMDKNNML